MPKTQIFKTIQSGSFLEVLLSKIASLLMKAAVPIAKTILAPLWLTAAASAIDACSQKEIHGSGTAFLIISNEEMNDIIKTAQALEDSNVLLKEINATIENETKKEKKRIFRNVFSYFRSYFIEKYVIKKEKEY